MPTASAWFRRLRWLLLVLLLLAVPAAWLAPYLDAELTPWLSHPVLVEPTAPALARGHLVDDYFAVEELGPGVYGIGEPRYWQQNYSYLIVGTQRAVLFDAGSGTRNLNAVVRKLTNLPVIESHLVQEPDYESAEARAGWTEEQFTRYAQALGGNKIGGAPLFLQGDEFPPGADWRLALQLDSAAVPFFVNFGDAGIGYAFVDVSQRLGRFLWQCA